MSELRDMADAIRARMAADGAPPSVRARMVVRLRALGRSAERVGRQLARASAAVAAVQKGDPA